jgi:hypothetical protein
MMRTWSPPERQAISQTGIGRRVNRGGGMLHGPARQTSVADAVGMRFAKR